VCQGRADGSGPYSIIAYLPDNPIYSWATADNCTDPVCESCHTGTFYLRTNEPPCFSVDAAGIGRGASFLGFPLVAPTTTSTSSATTTTTTTTGASGGNNAPADTDSGNKKKNHLPLGLGIGLGVGVPFLAIVVFLSYRGTNKKSKRSSVVPLEQKVSDNE